MNALKGPKAKSVNFETPTPQKVSEHGQALLETLVVLVLVLIPLVSLSSYWMANLWKDLQCEIKTFDQARIKLLNDSLELDSGDFVSAFHFCNHQTYEVKLWKLQALEAARSL